jgi:6-phosphogluconolactonase
MRSFLHSLLPLAALACAALHVACGGDDTTSGSGGASASGTGSGGAGPGSTSASGSSGSAGGGAGGEAPTGTPYAYVGSGDGKIHVFSLDLESGALLPVDETEAGANPSFLAFSPDKRFLYAADEGAGELAAFSIDASTGMLSPLNRVSSNGGGPAHIAVDATGAFVFGVNYGGGSVTVVRVEANGGLGSAITTLPTGANAHQVVLDPANRFAFVPNKGADDVSQLVFDERTGALSPNAVPEVDVAAGAGPRHMAFHPSAPYAYVIDENDDTLVALSYDAGDGRLTPFQTESTLPVDFDGDDNTCAEVAFSKSGRFLYGSNRGHDSLAIFEVDDATGHMSFVAHQSTAGSTPRHFSIEPAGNVLLVGNQQSNNVVTFRVDQATGLLTELLTTPVSGGPEFVGVLYLSPRGD